VFDGEVRFYKTQFYGELDFKGAVFAADSWFGYASFAEDVQFSSPYGDGNWTLFENKAEFPNVSFKSLARFKGVKFKNGVDFSEVIFHDEGDFRETIYEGDSSFRQTVFKGPAKFRDTEFHTKVRFGGAQFRANANFKKATFESEARFWTPSERKNTVFKGISDFRGTSFGSDANFRTVQFGKETYFQKARFEEPPVFSGSNCDNVAFTDLALAEADFSEASLINADLKGTTANSASFREAHLENADLEEADFQNVDFERAKLSNSDLFGTNLSGTQLYGARIGDAAINTETVLDKYGEYRCVYDPNSEYDYDPNDGAQVGKLRKAMGAYHVLEQLTRANTLPDEQSKFFARRQDMRRGQLQNEGRQMAYWFAEAQNAVFRHGESFSRVVGWSVGTIVAFAFIFPFGGWLQSASTGTLTYGAIAESPELMWQAFYHSLLLFLTGSGPLSPTGFVGEMLTAIESVIAPILLALLIFVLGRRAAR
jgi:uncharacterized protein YjbI with pentapeptide repeats